MSRTPNQRLATYCRRQHGVFTLQQALRAGLSSGTVYRRVRARTYEQVFPGVFRHASAPDSFIARCLAAQLAIGGDATLARQTAASLHGMEHNAPRNAIHLVVHTRSFDDLPKGLVVHRARHLDTSQVVRHRGVLMVTSVTRTLCDMAAIVDANTLRAMVAASVRRGTTTAKELRDLAERLGRLRGKRALMTILDELSPLERVTRSDLESLFLSVTTCAGIPPDDMNHPVIDAFGRRRLLDAVYLDERQPVELDSREFHGTLLDWNDDLRRENAIRLVGWRDPLRFSWGDLRVRPDEVVQVIRMALELARQEPGRLGA